MSTTLRGQEEQVKPLELFFDLVFVLALTQCTALMSHEPTWEGVAKGLLVLGVLWWSWVGYSWLTSVVDPEEGAVRLTMFAAMAALLVAALCVPTVFDDTALLFAATYLHFPMVAGIVLVALGFKKTLAHVGDELDLVPASALLGGTALYLLAHVAFRWRNVHRFSSARLLAACACVALLPVAVAVPALATLSMLAALLCVLVVYERARFAELRARLPHPAAAAG